MSIKISSQYLEKHCLGRIGVVLGPIKIATFHARNVSAKLPIFNQYRERMCRLFITPYKKLSFPVCLPVPAQGFK